MQYEDENLAFLQKKIAEIKVALFKADIGEYAFLIPNNIISTLKTDSNGNIWFYTSCLGYNIDDILKNFHAYLDFYQKGSTCRLRIEGKASIVKYGGTVIRLFPDYQKSMSNSILIQMKILHAEYYENRSVLSSSLKSRVIDFFSELLFSRSTREFNFN